MNLQKRKQEVDAKFNELDKKRSSFLAEVQKIEKEMAMLQGAYRELEYIEKMLEASKK